MAGVLFAAQSLARADSRRIVVLGASGHEKEAEDTSSAHKLVPLTKYSKGVLRELRAQRLVVLSDVFGVDEERAASEAEEMGIPVVYF